MVSEADFKVKCEKMTSERTKFWLKFQPIPMYLGTAVEILSNFRKILSHIAVLQYDKVRILIYVRFWI